MHNTKANLLFTPKELVIINAADLLVPPDHLEMFDNHPCGEMFRGYQSIEIAEEVIALLYKGGVMAFNPKYDSKRQNSFYIASKAWIELNRSAVNKALSHIIPT